MLEIKAVIRPHKLTAVREALRELPGFPGMTATRVEGCSAPTRHQPHSIGEELIDFSAKVRIEIVSEARLADAIVACILRVARTNHVGDGLVWTTPVGQVQYLDPGETPSVPGNRGVD